MEQHFCDSFHFFSEHNHTSPVSNASSSNRSEKTASASVRTAHLKKTETSFSSIARLLSKTQSQHALTELFQHQSTSDESLLDNFFNYSSFFQNYIPQNNLSKLSDQLLNYNGKESPMSKFFSQVGGTGNLVNKTDDVLKHLITSPRTHPNNNIGHSHLNGNHASIVGSMLAKRPTLNLSLEQLSSLEKSKQQCNLNEFNHLLMHDMRDNQKYMNGNQKINQTGVNGGSRMKGSAMESLPSKGEDNMDVEDLEPVPKHDVSGFVSARHLKQSLGANQRLTKSTSSRFDPATSLKTVIDSSSSSSLPKKRNRFKPPLVDNQDEEEEEENKSKRQKTGISNTSASEVIAEDGKKSPFLDDGSLHPDLSNLDKSLVESIMNEIIDFNINVTWNDIAGLGDAKTIIQEAVIWPILNPDIFCGVRAPPRGILLFGPPGTGKTLIAKAIANESESTFFNISASSLMSKWVGEGEKLVKTLFALARFRQPSIVFIDEIDSLLSKRKESESGDASRRMKTEFLVQLDGAGTHNADRVLIVGATNLPWELDEAVRRRLEKRLYIALPNGEARKQLIVNLLKSVKYDLTGSDLDQVVERSEGYSGSDMSALVKDAAKGPVREITKTRNSIKGLKNDDLRAIKMIDFEHSFKQIRPSVDLNEIAKQIEWNKQFGSSSSED